MDIFNQKPILDMWVIYDHPKDHPNHFVVRKWTIMHNAAPLASTDKTLHDTLEEAREAIPPGLYNLERYADDDPVIKEVWV